MPSHPKIEKVTPITEDKMKSITSKRSIQIDLKSNQTQESSIPIPISSRVIIPQNVMTSKTELNLSKKSSIKPISDNKKVPIKATPIVEETKKQPPPPPVQNNDS